MDGRKETPVRAFWWNANPPNFGDEISPVILDAFVHERIEWVPRETEGKMLAIGSLIHTIQPKDIVWGTGTQVLQVTEAPPFTKFLAVRGQITRAMIKGGNVPRVFGDPGLLLPLVYHPEVGKKYEVGILPHYNDKKFVKLEPGQHLIDIQSGWQNVIKEVLSCEQIIASALHGLICAEAYGIPVTWWRYGERIQNQEMKGDDYFLGTGRQEQELFKETEPIPDLPRIQNRLLKALRERI